MNSTNYIGKQIGNYQLIAEIASGAFGSVFQGKHIIFVDRPPVAVKLLHASYIGSAQERERFIHEARVLEKLKHPYSLSIIDAGIHEGTPYLIMEYASNGSLRYLLRRQFPRPLSLGQALTILSQIGQALQHAHQLNIIHRDLKPENILFNSRGEALLADYGIAVVLQTSSIRQIDATGTPAYMAPEQFRGQISKESDQYALSCIAYELLTGRQPFSAPDFVAMGFLHATETPIPPTQLNPQLPHFIDQAILKAMAKQRADRHADIAAFLQSLHPPVPSEAALPTVIAPLAPPIPASPTPAPPLIVAQRGGGHYTSINEAIRHAKAKARILVRPGIYLEELVLDKPVEIIGDGPREQIILESRDADCILMQTDTAIVQGLTLRCRAGLKNKKYYAVGIPRGQLTLQDCDITSDSLACVAIHGSTATPVVRSCTIHDGKAGGVYVYENGQGRIEDCNIVGNALAGVQIETGGNPVVCKCTIHDGKAGGVFVNENGQGTIEDCDIWGNARAGVEIKMGGNPQIQRCRIHRNKYEAIWIYEKGQGTIKNCDLTGNTRGAWDIGSDCRVYRSGNKE